MVAEAIRGGCLCGAVRYEFHSPQLTAVCHCTNCQKQSGSAFSVVVIAPSHALTIAGKLQIYEDHGDSGAMVLRQFCPICGSPIFTASPGGEVVAIKGGSLDLQAAAPVIEIYCDSSLTWYPALEGTTRFPKAMT